MYLKSGLYCWRCLNTEELSIKCSHRNYFKILIFNHFVWCVFCAANKSRPEGLHNNMYLSISLLWGFCWTKGGFSSLAKRDFVTEFIIFSDGRVTTQNIILFAFKRKLIRHTILLIKNFFGILSFLFCFYWKKPF